MVLVAALSQAGCRPGGGDATRRTNAPPAVVTAVARLPMSQERVWTLARPFLGDPLKNGFRATIEVIDGDRLKLTTKLPTRRVIYLGEVEGGISVSDDAGFRNPRLYPPEKTTASNFDKGVLKAMRASGSRSDLVGKIEVMGHEDLIDVSVERYPPMPGGHGIFSFKKSGELLRYMGGK